MATSPTAIPQAIVNRGRRTATPTWHASIVDEQDVTTVVQALTAAGCRFWVAGGWAVDVLVGRPTRLHRDLDLALDIRDEPSASGALEALGYRVETDQRPVRVEFAAPDARWVDLHPVAFGSAGDGYQAAPDGGFFFYPRECLRMGVLGGVAVPCLSVAQQLQFRSGYPPRDVDHHDVALLKQLRTAGQP